MKITPGSRRGDSRIAPITRPLTLTIAAALILFLTACSPTPAQVNNAGHEPFEKAEAEVEVAPDADNRDDRERGLHQVGYSSNVQCYDNQRGV